jgi:hypothetical protein
MSYSALNTYESCGRNYYLSRIKNAEELQAWYLLVGSAIHDGIEHFLQTGTKKSAEEVFYPLVSKALLIEPDTSLWLAGGPKDNPIVEDKATAQVEQCLEAAYRYLQDVEVWEVEYDATGPLPGLEVPVKAFVDIIGEHKKYGPCIIDWKSGSTKPKSNLQLETYAALLNFTDHPYNEHMSIQFHTGLWAMLKEGTAQARPVDLSGVDPVALGKRYQAAYDRIKAKIFPYESGYMCRFCLNAPNCKLESGPTERANYYDKVEEDGGYPF